MADSSSRRRSPESSRRRRRERRAASRERTNATTAEFAPSVVPAPSTNYYDASTPGPTMQDRSAPVDINRQQHGYRARPGSSSSGSSSTSSSLLDISRRYSGEHERGGVFQTFFRAPSSRLRRRRSGKKKKKNKRVLYFGNSSSSSLNSDLAYGTGYIPWQKSSRDSSQKHQHQHQNSAPVAAAAAAGATYATMQNQGPLYPQGPSQYASSHGHSQSYSHPPPQNTAPNSTSWNPGATAATAAAAGAAVGLAADYYNQDRSFPAKPATPRRRKTDDEIMAIGRQLSDLAKAQNEDDLRAAGISKPSGLVSAATKYSDYRNSKNGTRSRGIGGSKLDSSSDDSDWESASDDDSDDSADSNLAFGTVVSAAIRPTAAAAAGAAAGAAIAGSRDQSGRSAVDPRYFGPVNSLHGMVTPLPFDSNGRPVRREPRPLTRSATEPMGPMRNVYPIATSDPTRFDATPGDLPRHARPGPVPLQQPTPRQTVSPKVYDAEKLEDATRKVDKSRRSEESGWGGAAAAGVAAGLVGAALTKDRKEDKDSHRDEEKREKRSERGDKREKEREKEKDEKRKSKRDSYSSKYPEDRDRDKEREREKDEKRKSKRDSYSSKYPEDKDRDKDRKRSSKYDDRDESKKSRDAVPLESTRDSYKRRDKPDEGRSELSGLSRRDSSKFNLPAKYNTPSEPRQLPGPEKAGSYQTTDAAPSKSAVDPFQYQVEDFAQAPSSEPPRPLTPNVFTVAREPVWDSTDDELPQGRLSRKDSFEIEQMVEENRKRHTPEEQRSTSDQIISKAAHAVAPVGAAAMAGAIVAEGARSRDRKRDAYSDDGSEVRTRDAVQDEADKYYREAEAARKIASDRVRSRNHSPERSVVDRYQDDNVRDVPTIVTPPEYKNHEHKDEEHHADFKLDNRWTPSEAAKYTGILNQPVVDAERERPYLNLIYPTPASSRRPTPALEQQEDTPRSTDRDYKDDSEKDRSSKKKSKKDRDEASRSEVGSSKRRTKDRDERSSKSEVGVSSSRRRRTKDLEDETSKSDAGAVVVVGPDGDIQTSKSVSWGENRTDTFEVVTPEPREDREIGGKTRPALDKTSQWGAIATAIAANSREPRNEPDYVESPKEIDSVTRSRDMPVYHVEDTPPVPGPKPASPGPQQMPGTFADDIDFAATLAAGLEKTGFDANMVIDDPTYRRRDSPPGSNELNGNGLYQKPFTETVSDLHSREPQPGPSEPGFVLGEVETPGDSSRAVDPVAEFAETPKLSKKERKKQEKLKKQQDAEAALEISAEAAEPPAEEEPKLSKKEQRKRDKEAKARALTEDNEIYAEPEQIKEPETFEDAWEDSSSKKKSRKSRDYDDGATSVSVPVEAYADLTSARDADYDDDKKSRKSKRDSKSYDMSRSVDDLGLSQHDDEWDELKKSKKKSKRDSLYDSPSRSVTDLSKIVDPEDEDDTKSRRRSKRDSGAYDSPSRSAAASEAGSEVSRKSSKKSKRRSGTEDEFDDRPPDRGRDPFEDRDVSSVVSEPRDDKRSSRRSYRYDDDDDAKSVASAPGGGRKKVSEKRSSGGLFSSIFKKDNQSKESFLDNAGILGAGVGLAGAVAAADSLSRHNATEALSEKKDPSEEIADWSRGVQDDFDSGISARTIKPAIDPQYGDLLPLPPSEPGTPIESPEEDLPSLPESRPDTPPEEQSFRYAHARRKSAQETPAKSPSNTAIPFQLRLGNRSGPSSPAFHKSSPVASPMPESPGSARKARPTSWDDSHDYKPLYLVEHNRKGPQEDPLDSADLPALPPSEASSRSSPGPGSEAWESADEYAHGGYDQTGYDEPTLRLDTSIPAFTPGHDRAGSQDTTPKAEIKPEFPDMSGATEPDPIEPMSKDRSSYLLQSAPSSTKSTKTVDNDTIARNLQEIAETPSKPGNKNSLADLDESLTSADEHFSDAREDKDERSPSHSRDLSGEAVTAPHTPAEQSSADATPAAEEPAEDFSMLTGKAKKKAKKNAKKKQEKASTWEDNLPATAGAAALAAGATAAAVAASGEDKLADDKNLNTAKESAPEVNKDAQPGQPEKSLEQVVKSLAEEDSKQAIADDTATDTPGEPTEAKVSAEAEPAAMAENDDSWMIGLSKSQIKKRKKQMEKEKAEAQLEPAIQLAPELEPNVPGEAVPASGLVSTETPASTEEVPGVEPAPVAEEDDSWMVGLSKSQIKKRKKQMEKEKEEAQAKSVDKLAEPEAQAAEDAAFDSKKAVEPAAETTPEPSTEEPEAWEATGKKDKKKKHKGKAPLPEVDEHISAVEPEATPTDEAPPQNKPLSIEETTKPTLAEEVSFEEKSLSVDETAKIPETTANVEDEGEVKEPGSADDVLSARPLSKKEKKRQKKKAALQTDDSWIKEAEGDVLEPIAEPSAVETEKDEAATEPTATEKAPQDPAEATQDEAPATADEPVQTEEELAPASKKKKKKDKKKALALQLDTPDEPKLPDEKGLDTAEEPLTAIVATGDDASAWDQSLEDKPPALQNTEAGKDEARPLHSEVSEPLFSQDEPSAVTTQAPSTQEFDMLAAAKEVSEPVESTWEAPSFKKSKKDKKKKKKQEQQEEEGASKVEPEEIKLEPAAETEVEVPAAWDIHESQDPVEASYLDPIAEDEEVQTDEYERRYRPEELDWDNYEQEAGPAKPEDDGWDMDDDFFSKPTPKEEVNDDLGWDKPQTATEKDEPSEDEWSTLVTGKKAKKNKKKKALDLIQDPAAGASASSDAAEPSQEQQEQPAGDDWATPTKKSRSKDKAASEETSATYKSATSSLEAQDDDALDAMQEGMSTPRPPSASTEATEIWQEAESQISESEQRSATTEDNDFLFPTKLSKKDKKKKKKQVALETSAEDTLDAESVAGTTDDSPENTSGFVTPAESVSGEANPDDEWGGFSSKKSKKEKKKKKAKDSESEPQEPTADDNRESESQNRSLDMLDDGAAAKESGEFQSEQEQEVGMSKMEKKKKGLSFDVSEETSPETTSETQLNEQDPAHYTPPADDDWTSKKDKKKKRKSVTFDLGEHASGEQEQDRDTSEGHTEGELPTSHQESKDQVESDLLQQDDVDDPLKEVDTFSQPTETEDQPAAEEVSEAPLSKKDKKKKEKAEEAAAALEDTKASKDTPAVEQTPAPEDSAASPNESVAPVDQSAQEAESVAEEQELADLEARKAKKGRLVKKADRERYTELKARSEQRAEAKAAEEAAALPEPDPSQDAAVQSSRALDIEAEPSAGEEVTSSSGEHQPEENLIQEPELTTSDTSAGQSASEAVPEPVPAVAEDDSWMAGLTKSQIKKRKKQVEKEQAAAALSEIGPSEESTGDSPRATEPEAESSSPEKLLVETGDAQTKELQIEEPRPRETSLQEPEFATIDTPAGTSAHKPELETSAEPTPVADDDSWMVGLSKSQIKKRKKQIEKEKEEAQVEEPQVKEFQFEEGSPHEPESVGLGTPAAEAAELELTTELAAEHATELDSAPLAEDDDSWMVGLTKSQIKKRKKQMEKEKAGRERAAEEQSQDAPAEPEETKPESVTISEAPQSEETPSRGLETVSPDTSQPAVESEPPIGEADDSWMIGLTKSQIKKRKKAMATAAAAAAAEPEESKVESALVLDEAAVKERVLPSEDLDDTTSRDKPAEDKPSEDIPAADKPYQAETDLSSPAGLSEETEMPSTADPGEPSEGADNDQFAGLSRKQALDHWEPTNEIAAEPEKVPEGTSASAEVYAQPQIEATASLEEPAPATEPLEDVRKTASGDKSLLTEEQLAESSAADTETPKIEERSAASSTKDVPAQSHEDDDSWMVGLTKSQVKKRRKQLEKEKEEAAARASESADTFPTEPQPPEYTETVQPAPEIETADSTVEAAVEPAATVAPVAANVPAAEPEEAATAELKTHMDDVPPEELGNSQPHINDTLDLAEAAELAVEENELAELEAKRAKKGKLSKKRDRERYEVLKEKAAKRAEAAAAAPEPEGTSQSESIDEGLTSAPAPEGEDDVKLEPSEKDEKTKDEAIAQTLEDKPAQLESTVPNQDVDEPTPPGQDLDESKPTATEPDRPAMEPEAAVEISPEAVPTESQTDALEASTAPGAEDEDEFAGLSSKEKKKRKKAKTLAWAQAEAPETVEPLSESQATLDEAPVEPQEDSAEVAADEAELQALEEKKAKKGKLGRSADRLRYDELKERAQRRAEAKATQGTDAHETPAEAEIEDISTEPHNNFAEAAAEEAELQALEEKKAKKGKLGRKADRARYDELRERADKRAEAKAAQEAEAPEAPVEAEAKDAPPETSIEPQTATVEPDFTITKPEPASEAPQEAEAAEAALESQDTGAPTQPEFRGIAEAGPSETAEPSEPVSTEGDEFAGLSKKEKKKAMKAKKEQALAWDEPAETLRSEEPADSREVEATSGILQEPEATEATEVHSGAPKSALAEEDEYTGLSSKEMKKRKKAKEKVLATAWEPEEEPATSTQQDEEDPQKAVEHVPEGTPIDSSSALVSSEHAEEELKSAEVAIEPTTAGTAPPEDDWDFGLSKKEKKKKKKELERAKLDAMDWEATAPGNEAEALEEPQNLDKPAELEALQAEFPGRVSPEVVEEPSLDGEQIDKTLTPSAAAQTPLEQPAEDEWGFGLSKKDKKKKKEPQNAQALDLDTSTPTKPTQELGAFEQPEPSATGPFEAFAPTVPWASAQEVAPAQTEEARKVVDAPTEISPASAPADDPSTEASASLPVDTTTEALKEEDEFAGLSKKERKKRQKEKTRVMDMDWQPAADPEPPATAADSSTPQQSEPVSERTVEATPAIDEPTGEIAAESVEVPTEAALEDDSWLGLSKKDKKKKKKSKALDFSAWDEPEPAQPETSAQAEEALKSKDLEVVTVSQEQLTPEAQHEALKGDDTFALAGLSKKDKKKLKKKALAQGLPDPFAETSAPDEAPLGEPSNPNEPVVVDKAHAPEETEMVDAAIEEPFEEAEKKTEDLNLPVPEDDNEQPEPTPAAEETPEAAREEQSTSADSGQPFDTRSEAQETEEWLQPTKKSKKEKKKAQKAAEAAALAVSLAANNEPVEERSAELGQAEPRTIDHPLTDNRPTDGTFSADEGPRQPHEWPAEPIEKQPSQEVEDPLASEPQPAADDDWAAISTKKSKKDKKKKKQIALDLSDPPVESGEPEDVRKPSIAATADTTTQAEETARPDTTTLPWSIEPAVADDEFAMPSKKSKKPKKLEASKLAMVESQTEENDSSKRFSLEEFPSTDKLMEDTNQTGPSSRDINVQDTPEVKLSEVGAGVAEPATEAVEADAQDVWAAPSKKKKNSKKEIKKTKTSGEPTTTSDDLGLRQEHTPVKSDVDDKETATADRDVAMDETTPDEAASLSKQSQAETFDVYQQSWDFPSASQDVTAAEVPETKEATIASPKHSDNKSMSSDIGKAAALGAAAVGLSAVAGKSAPASKGKKGKKNKKSIDKRAPQEDDIFDDPSLWENADKRNLQENDEERVDDDSWGEGEGTKRQLAAKENDDFWGGGADADEAETEAGRDTGEFEREEAGLEEPPAEPAEDPAEDSAEVAAEEVELRALEKKKAKKGKLARSADRRRYDELRERAALRARSQPAANRGRNDATSKPVQDWTEHDDTVPVVHDAPRSLLAPTTQDFGAADKDQDKTKDLSITHQTESFSGSDGGWKETAQRGAPLDDYDNDDSPVLGRGEQATKRSQPAGLLRRGSDMDEPVGGLLREDSQAMALTGPLGSDFGGTRLSPARSLPGIQEVPEAEEVTNARGLAQTPDLNRDSGFVESPKSSFRSRSRSHLFAPQSEEQQPRDSGYHDDDEPPTLSSETPKSHKKRSSHGTPKLQEPAATELTPEPTKSSKARKSDYYEQSPLRSSASRDLRDAPTLRSSDSRRDLQASPSLRSMRSRDYGDLRSESKKPSALPVASSTSARSASDTVAQPRQEESQPQARRSLSNTSLSRKRTPEPLKFRPESPGIHGQGVRSTPTPPLRRVDKRVSGDLRSLRQQPSHPTLPRPGPGQTTSSPPDASSSQTQPQPIANEGRVRSKDMADVYDGFGEGRMGSPRSPTRPHSMRRRQSMQVLELESRVDQLMAENRLLTDARTHAEQNLSQRATSILTERDSEIEALKQSLQFLQKEVTRLTEVNEGLSSANAELAQKDNGRYTDLEVRHADVARELDEARGAHNTFEQSLQDKDAEIADLRAQLEDAKEQVREAQRQILASKAGDSDFLDVLDEDHFDNRCQQLCSHVQQWVLRFSKFSDMRACRLTGEINDEKTIDRLDNAVLDGSDVDRYLSDRVKRRDIFMSMTMNMIWEFVFTRYLFGMDREQRQKLKSLEKLLTEVGPPQAVRQWRAVTLTLLARRDNFKQQKDQDTEAVVQAIFQTLCKILPPPSNLENQIQSQLRRVLREAVDLSIEMRTQKAEYMMLPPLQPEYDSEGELAATVQFNASMMNERSGKNASSNEDLEAEGAVVRVVLFPLVVKKGDDAGVGDEEIVVCPAQVVVASKGRRSFAPSSDAGGASLGGRSHMSVVTEHMV